MLSLLIPVASLDAALSRFAVFTCAVRPWLHGLSSWGDHAVTVLCSNHELWQNFTAYKTRFSMPNHDNFENMRHSYTVGNTHFLNMNTETWIDTANIDPAQQQWIATDLAGVLCCVVCCVFVGHWLHGLGSWYLCTPFPHCWFT